MTSGCQDEWMQDCEKPAYDGITNHQIRMQLESILSDETPVDWNAVSCLLPFLKINNAIGEDSYASDQDDPMGRLLLARLLARDAPAAIVDTAIAFFPRSLHHNPAAFLAASQNSSPEVLKRMFCQIAGRDDPCPYPWIISDCISVESAKILLETFPEGVMKPSGFLSSFNLVDYFLISPDIIKRRTFDVKLWNKFKLVLVAVGSLLKKGCSCCGCEIAPVHLILNRVLSRSGMSPSPYIYCGCNDFRNHLADIHSTNEDFWTSPDKVQHVLWLLHQLRWTDRWIFERRSKHGRYPIHVVLSYKCTSDHRGLVAARALTQLLLEACPTSASHRFHGKLPLHMAVENGWPCHDLLLAAHPESLDVLDPTTALFPFQTAANHHRFFETPISLDITYELLRANPMHACCLHKETRGVRAQA